jgi:hypothetical protein
MDPSSQALNSTESLLSSSLHSAYRIAIGQMLYLTTKTGHDTAVAVRVVAGHVSAPAEVNWTAIRRNLRYFKGTTTDGQHIVLITDKLIGQADADWGGESCLPGGQTITIGS